MGIDSNTEILLSMIDCSLLAAAIPEFRPTKLLLLTKNELMLL